ncbi:hypothetical protein [Brevundimonas denitrificans]
MATKLQDFNMSPDGLIGNLLAFNVASRLASFWRSAPS